jgi:hypothetical protein
MSKKQRRFVLSVLCLAFASIAAAGQAATTAAKPLDPCVLLTKQEIQEVLGQPVGDGKPNMNANPQVGQLCQFKVGDYGVFSLLTKTAGPGENAASAMAQIRKKGKPCAEVPGLGDGSFYFDAGYGVLSLNTFKGSEYLIITMLVPGLSPDTQRACAEKLMSKALAKF